MCKNYRQSRIWGNVGEKLADRVAFEECVKIQKGLLRKQ